MNLEPVIPVSAIVAQQLWRLPIVADQEVQVAIVVKISRRQAPADARRLDIRPQPSTHVLEDASAVVFEYELGLRIRGAGVIEADIVEDVTVGNNDIPAPIVIVVDESRSKAAVVPGGVTQLCGKRRIFERSVSQIAIETRVLVVEMGHENVHPSSSPGVGRVGSHSRFAPSGFANSHARSESNLPKGPVALVLKQKVGHGIIRDENVLPPVLVEIQGDNPKAVPRLGSHAGGFAHVRKGAIPLVMVQRRGLSPVNIRMAVGAIFGPPTAAIVFRRPVHIIGDYQVEIAVLVIIKPGCTGCPFPHVGNAGSVCYISERAVAVIVKEDGTSVP